MVKLYYIDRETGQKEREKVYGGFYLTLLYGEGWLSKCISLCILPLIARCAFFSKWYGSLQKKARSKKKILSFIRKYHIDTKEFLDHPETFASFNDFFTRKLKRSIDDVSHSAIIPADGRYKIYTSIEMFKVKGKRFSLEKFLGDRSLAERYAMGNMVIARLCPVDYHRFHFPCDGIPKSPRLINGPLYSVNPIALKRNLSILWENKRMITEIETKEFGIMQYIEVGATCVGSIQQTFTPHIPCKKGQEKGYFEFGGSCLILLFEPRVIAFDEDLVHKDVEVYAKWGQSMGKRATNRA